MREKRAWQLSDHWARSFAALLHYRLWGENKNFIVIFVGETGSGKSYSALALAEMIDPNFDISKVVYTPEEFFEVLDRVGKGEVVIFDEAGVGVPAREWQTIQNRLMSYVLQVFRYKNIGVIFTTPSSDFIDKHVKLLCHYQILVLGHNSENQNICIVYKKKHHHVKGGLDWDALIFEAGKKQYRPRYILIGLPSEYLVNEYEKLSRQRKEEIRKKALEDLKALKEGLKAEGFDGRSLRRLKNIARAFYKTYTLLRSEFGLSERQIALKIGLDPQNLNRWIKWIEANREMFSL